MILRVVQRVDRVILRVLLRVGREGNRKGRMENVRVGGVGVRSHTTKSRPARTDNSPGNTKS